MVKVFGRGAQHQHCIEEWRWQNGVDSGERTELRRLAIERSRRVMQDGGGVAGGAESQITDSKLV